MALINDPSVRRHSYAALESPEHIRLIALHPAMSKHAPLRIEFFSSTLEDVEGRYEAVSYTWGQPILAFALHVDDGTQVFVTENLDRALRYLRRADRDRLLWADAASINQADNEEKAVQIPLMVQIFRGARSVLAWLDPGGDTSPEQRGMHMLNRLSRWSEAQMWSSTEDFDEVSLFLSLPWFNRLWIIQEVVFSVDIDLICGSTELTFARLMAGLNVLERHFPLSKPIREATIGNIDEIGKLWNHHSLFNLTTDRKSASMFETPTEILSLVENFCSYGCTDLRDRIFALCSMATDVRHASLKIDYSLDVCGTYQAFALSCWKRSHGQMWEALLSRQHSPRSTDLSSWAPDWRVLSRARWCMFPCSPAYPSIMVTESAAGIVRMRFFVRGLPPDGGFERLHTIKLKTSRTPKDNQTSLLSQILPLYMLLRNPRRCLGQSYLVPDKKRWISNILTDMIEALLPRYKYTSSLRKLDIHLATMTAAFEQNDANCNTETPSLEIRNLIYELDKALEDNELFCFQDPKTQVYSVGVGNKKLETGDEIVILDKESGPLMWNELIMVLILRRVGYVDDTPLPAFRLIGSGYLLNYTCVHLFQVSRPFQGDKKTRAEQAAWKEFQKNFWQNKAYQFLNLV